MAKKKDTQRDETQSGESTTGEQLDLIDVSPKNSEKIIGIAKRYKAAQSERIAALERETTEKQKLLQAVKEAKLQPLEDGTTKFRIDGMTITIRPRDELIKVKEDEEEKTD